MKIKILVFTGLLLLLSGNLFSYKVITKSDNSPDGTITIASTPALSGLASELTKEYSKLNPELKINVCNVNEASKAEFQASGAAFGFASADEITSQESETLWKMAVGRDIIVPVMNSNNPYLEEILKQGISSEKFAQIFSNPEKQVWTTILINGQNVPLHIYLSSDESVLASVKKFLNIDRFPVDGIDIKSEKETITSIQNDPYSIGFCKMADIIRADQQSLTENIRLLPIDKNGNGKIDNLENIYTDTDVFTRGVWIGKYPKSLYRDVYFVSEAQPSNENETAFLKWVLTNGQQFLLANGISDLVYSERQSKLEKFNNFIIKVPPSDNIYSFPSLAAIVLSALIILSIVISAIIYYRKNKKLSVQAAYEISPHVFSENSLIVMGGLYYDKTHTWAFMEKDGSVKIGIDDFLQHITGPITRVEMKKPGEKIKKGDMILSIIQRGKQLNIYAPLSGTIKNHNKMLITNSSVINSSPYSDGWVYVIEPTNWLREIQFLDMAEKYKNWVLSEFSRVKDFLASSLKVNKIEYEHVVLQDGGVLKDNVLEDLGPEIWEDFQANFLDTYK